MVAATRSRVWEEFGAPSPRKTGAAAASLRGFSDQLNSIELSRNLSNYTCLISKSVAPEGYVKQGRQAAGRRRGRQQSPAFKPCRRNAAVQAASEVATTSTFRAGADNDQLEPQTIRSDFGGSEIPTLLACESRNPSSVSITPLSTVKFGMYAGRVKANPLKYLANVLRSKLQPHYESCNLLEIATEIHHEAKNKHNTTLRRIYDVVNVLDAAGLLERSNGSTPKRSSRNRCPNECTSTSDTVVTGSPSRIESFKSAVEFAVDFEECHDEQTDIYFGNRPPSKEHNPLEKKSARGSRIRWLRSASENKYRQTLGRLSEGKIAAVQRVSEKQREFEYLQEELRLTTELIKHNQSRLYQSGHFDFSNMNPCTPPPEDLSCSYLNFEDCSQTSSETEHSHEISLELKAVFATAATNDSSAMCGSSSWWSSTSQDFHPARNRLAVITEADGDYDYNQSSTEVGMNILEAAGQYQSSSLPRAISGTALRGLHVPFVILQTNNNTNVDIDLASNETSEVSIVLDDEYKLFDYRELLSSMFPAQDCNG